MPPATLDAPTPAAAAPPVVSLDEMARLLGISLPTMRDRTKLPGFPVISKGSNGVPWQLDPAAVTAFLVEQDRQAQEADALRSAALAQYALPIAEDPATPTVPGTINPADRLRMAQALLKEDELARQRAFLVLTTDMRQCLNQAWAPLAAFLTALPGSLSRRHNLPDAVVRDMRNAIDSQRRALVERLRDLAPDSAQTDPTPDDLAA
jgi:phage terminase Nu1 subunit (DNA packaging protein)